MEECLEKSVIDVNCVKKDIQETLQINFSDTQQTDNILRANGFEFKICSKNGKDLKMCVFINQGNITSFMFLINKGETIDTETQRHFEFKRYQNTPDLKNEIANILKKLAKGEENIAITH